MPGPWEKYQTTDLSSDTLSVESLETKPWEKYQQPEGPDVLGEFKDFFTKDIPGAFKGAGERLTARGERVEAPTRLGLAAKEVTGLEGLPGEIAEGVFSGPEKIARIGAGVIGTLGEIVSVPVEIVTKGINRLLGGKPGELLQKAVKKGVNSKPGRKVVDATSKFWESLPEEDRANYGSIPDLLDAIGVKGGAVAKQAISPKKLKSVIETGVKKGIKPAVTKAGVVSKNAQKAVETIIDNKNIINLVDDAGKQILPRNAQEFFSAIEKTKAEIYRQYHGQAVKAGQTGKASFDLKNVNKKLDEIIKGVKKEARSKTIRDHAAKVKAEIQELAGKSPEIIEERIKELNSSLTSFYHGSVTKPIAEVEVAVANLMRKELDDKITNAVGGQYQELKNKYKSLLQIQKQVEDRAIKNSQDIGSGLIDLTDPFTLSKLTTGILTQNPQLVAQGVSGRGLKELYKYLRNPDRQIKKMFEQASKIEKTKRGVKLGLGGVPGATSFPATPAFKGELRGLLENSGADDKDIDIVLDPFLGSGTN